MSFLKKIKKGIKKGIKKSKKSFAEEMKHKQEVKSAYKEARRKEDITLAKKKAKLEASNRYKELKQSINKPSNLNLNASKNSFGFFEPAPISIKEFKNQPKSSMKKFKEPLRYKF